MTPKEEHPAATERAISRKAWFFVALWTAGIVAIYAVIGATGIKTMRRYTAETHKLRQAWLASPATLLDEKLPAFAPSPTATPVTVSVLVNRIGGFILQESTWEADFDIAFRWRGAGIDPGKTFRIANGEILRRDLEISLVRNGEHYERCHVRARVEQAFDPSRIPFGDAALIVAIEDPAHDAQTMVYRVGGAGIHVSPVGYSQAVKVTKTFAGTKYFSYPVNGAKPWGNVADVYSQFVFAMLVHLRGWEIYTRMFQVLFGSVALALLALFLKPYHSSSRFDLGIGAFFAAVGNNIYLGTQLPPGDRISLTVLVNMLGLLTIFLTLVASSISLHIFHTRGQQRLSHIFDWITVAVLAIAYLTVNLLLPYAAMP